VIAKAAASTPDTPKIFCGGWLTMFEGIYMPPVASRLALRWAAQQPQ